MSITSLNTFQFGYTIPDPDTSHVTNLFSSFYLDDFSFFTMTNPPIEQQRLCSLTFTESLMSTLCEGVHIFVRRTSFLCILNTIILRESQRQCTDKDAHKDNNIDWFHCIQFRVCRIQVWK